MGLRRSFAAIALAGALIISAAACGSDSKDDELDPKARGPVLAGQLTCGYIDSPAECKDSGLPPEQWHKLPDQEPRADDHDHDMLMELFMWQMIYHTWFSSPMYTERYIVVDHRDSYRNRWSSFDRSYSSRYKTYESKATYVNTRTHKTVPGNKVNSTQFKAPAPKNNGGDRGKKVCGFMILGIGLDNPAKGGGSGGGSSGGRSGGSIGGGAKPAPAKPAPPAPKPAGGDKGKGGTSQHGC